MSIKQFIKPLQLAGSQQRGNGNTKTENKNNNQKDNITKENKAVLHNEMKKAEIKRKHKN